MVVHMSYSELVKELKLENRLMAVNRVHAADEQVNDIFGCVYKRFERVLNGETLVLKSAIRRRQKRCLSSCRRT